MEKNELLARIAAIVCALNETNGSPESMLYIFMDMDMDMWSKVRNILLDSGLIQIKAHYVTLTSKGVKTAQELEAVVRH